MSIRKLVFVLFLSVVFASLISGAEAYEPSTLSHPNASGFGQNDITWAQHRAEARVVFVSNEAQFKAALKDLRPLWIKPSGGMVIKSNSRIYLGNTGYKRILGLAPGGFIVLGSITDGDSHLKKNVTSIENMALYEYQQLGTLPTADNDDILQFTATSYILFRRLAIGGGRDEQVDAGSSSHISVLDSLFLMARTQHPEYQTGSGPTHESHLLIGSKAPYASAIRNSFPNGWDRAPLIQKYTGESILNLVTGNLHGSTTTCCTTYVTVAERAAWKQQVNIQFTGWESSAAVSRGDEPKVYVQSTPIQFNEYGNFSGQYNYIDYRPIRSGVFLNRSVVPHYISVNFKTDGGKFPFYPFKTVASQLNLVPFNFSKIPGYVPTTLPDKAEIDAAMARQNTLPTWLVRVREYSGPASVDEVMIWQRSLNRGRSMGLFGIPNSYTGIPKIDTSRMKPYPTEIITWLTRDGHIIQSDGYALIEHFDFEQEAAMMSAQTSGGSLDDIYAAQQVVIDEWRQKAITALNLPAPLPDPISPQLLNQISELRTKFILLNNNISILDSQLATYKASISSTDTKNQITNLETQVDSLALSATQFKDRLAVMQGLSNPLQAEADSISIRYTEILSSLNSLKSQFNIISAGYVPPEVILPTSNSSLRVSLDFSESPGSSRFIDKSSFGNDGTCSGTSCPIISNGSAVFDGVNDYITYPLTLPKSNGSIVHWIKPTVDRQMVLVYESDGSSVTTYNAFGTGGNNLEIHTARTSDGGAYFVIEDGASAQSIQGGDIPLNEWSFVVATWDRNKNMTLYVNGERINSKSLSAVNFGSKSPIVRQIGRTGDGSVNRSWTGSIDELQVYSRELSEEEVYDLYVLSASNYLDNPPSGGDEGPENDPLTPIEEDPNSGGNGGGSSSGVGGSSSGGGSSSSGRSINNSITLNNTSVLSRLPEGTELKYLIYIDEPVNGANYSFQDNISIRWDDNFINAENPTVEIRLLMGGKDIGRVNELFVLQNREYVWDTRAYFDDTLQVWRGVVSRNDYILQIRYVVDGKIIAAGESGNFGIVVREIGFNVGEFVNETILSIKRGFNYLLKSIGKLFFSSE